MTAMNYNFFCINKQNLEKLCIIQLKFHNSKVKVNIQKKLI